MESNRLFRDDRDALLERIARLEAELVVLRARESQEPRAGETPELQARKAQELRARRVALHVAALTALNAAGWQMFRSVINTGSDRGLWLLVLAAPVWLATNVWLLMRMSKGGG